MAWITPDSTYDPSATWSDDGNIKDNDTGTFAAWTFSGPGWTDYLQAFLDTPISCDKVRFWAEYNVARVNQLILYVYYEDAWHNIFQGAFNNKDWTEKIIPEGTKTVSGISIAFWHAGAGAWEAEYYECDFNEVPVPSQPKKWWFNLSARPDSEIVAAV